MSAQPFRQRERDRKRQHARRAARPDQPRECECKRSVEREPSGQADHRQWQQPAEHLGVDQKRIPDPVEAGEEVSKAEPPARACGRPDAAEPSSGCAIDEPQQDRKRHKGRGPHVGRWKREHRARAGEKGDQDSAPAPCQHHRMGQPDGRHGRRADFDAPASGESLAISARRAVTSGGSAGADAPGIAAAVTSCVGLCFPFIRSKPR